MKKIYIHIGMHRTGTSSFQKFLELNVEKLNSKKIGVFMPKQYGIANSSEYFLMESRSLSQEYLELKKFLKEEYESLIISGEELSKFDFKSIASLKSIMSSVPGAQIEILACIRGANQYIDSAGAKMIENSGHDFNSLMSAPGLIPMYSSIAAWGDLFPEMLEVFDYSSDTLFQLLNKIGLNNEEFIYPQKENSSKCLEFLAIKACLNDPRYVQALQLFAVICKGDGINKFVLPQEVAISIGAQVNREVRILNSALGIALDEINIYSRPEISKYSNQQFLASCVRYLLENLISAVPNMLVSGALAYCNSTKNSEDEFDPFGYLLSNFDLCSNAINPLDHYLRHGKSEGRTSFDSKIVEQIKLLGG
jgi:hypothetical protein